MLFSFFLVFRGLIVVGLEKTLPIVFLLFVFQAQGLLPITLGSGGFGMVFLAALLCPVDSHSAPLYVDVFHCALDNVGLILGHLEEREIGHQINAPNLHGLARIAIYHTDDVARIEIVALAQGNEETHIARFCLAMTSAATPAHTL